MTGQVNVIGMCFYLQREFSQVRRCKEKIGIVMEPCREILRKDIEKSVNHFRG